LTYFSHSDLPVFHPKHRNKHLVEDVKVGGSLGCSDHDVVEFRMNCVEEAGQ